MLRKTWMHVWRQNYEEKQQTLRRTSEITYDVMPADCGLDLDCISSPQPPAITTRKVPDSLWCHWCKAQRLYGNPHGEWQMHGSEKVPMTPTMPTAQRQDLNQECLPTRSTFLESQHISAKYIRYLKLLKGESVTITDLGIFSQFNGILSSIVNIVTSTFQAIQNYHSQRHTGGKFGISGKLQFCKFTGVSYKTVII